MLADVGGDLHDLSPGSEEAARLKNLFVAEGIWSRYLEVGIGPDALRNGQILSAVGTAVPLESLPPRTGTIPSPRGSHRSIKRSNRGGTLGK